LRYTGNLVVDSWNLYIKNRSRGNYDYEIYLTVVSRNMWFCIKEIRSTKFSGQILFVMARYYSN